MAEAAAGTAESAKAKGGSGGLAATFMNGLGLIVVITIGTCAGQYLADLLPGHAHQASPAGAVEEHGAPAKAAAKAPAKDAAPKEPPLYQAFEPMVVNFNEGGQLHFLQVTVEVMSRDPKTIAAVQANTPVLRNNLLLLISSREMQPLLTRDGKEQLRSMALEEVRKTMAKLSPEARIEDVYFSNFVMQ
ncbi:MAG TPA: flagellar basal body-associated FliL family protein [Steroidobacteraceae bacterium]|nr:flagellar basal body-associated FliL family protein [Steroidobacteraceae bacterium]